MIKTAIITLSDTRTTDTDTSAEAVKGLLDPGGYEVCDYKIIKDDGEELKKLLVAYADKLQLDLVITTGGTGPGPRDITPEATLEVIEKQLPGLSEFMRMAGVEKTKKALLSRGVCGVRGRTLIINVPGSPKGARESLEAIIDVVPHTVKMMRGGGH